MVVQIGPASAKDNSDGTTTLDTAEYILFVDKVAWLVERFGAIEAVQRTATKAEFDAEMEKMNALPATSAGSADRLRAS